MSTKQPAGLSDAELSTKPNPATAMKAAHLRAILAQDICPFCMGGPYRAVARHLRWCNAPNAVQATELKAMAGLPKSVPLISVELSEQMSVTAKERGIRPATQGRPTPGYSLPDITRRNHWHTGNSDINRDVPEARHGHLLGYTRDGCRCGQCRKAHADYRREVSAPRRRGDVSDRQHGTDQTYGNYGCRCDPCREAHRASMRRSVEKRRISWRAP